MQRRAVHAYAEMAPVAPPQADTPRWCGHGAAMVQPAVDERGPRGEDPGVAGRGSGLDHDQPAGRCRHRHREQFALLAGAEFAEHVRDGDQVGRGRRRIAERPAPPGRGAQHRRRRPERQRCALGERRLGLVGDRDRGDRRKPRRGRPCRGAGAAAQVEERRGHDSGRQPAERGVHGGERRRHPICGICSGIGGIRYDRRLRRGAGPIGFDQPADRPPQRVDRARRSTPRTGPLADRREGRARHLPRVRRVIGATCTGPHLPGC